MGQLEIASKIRSHLGTDPKYEGIEVVLTKRMHWPKQEPPILIGLGITLRRKGDHDNSPLMLQQAWRTEIEQYEGFDERQFHNIVDHLDELIDKGNSDAARRD